MSGGVKNDNGKPPVTLIPSCAITGMANAFAYGANKYGADNFREGIAYRRLADACMRHLLAFIEGEDMDAESGNPHIDHALASLAMLKFMTVHKTDMDDRWKPEGITVASEYGVSFALEPVKQPLNKNTRIITNMGDL